jgi:hypothetical protein
MGVLRFSDSIQTHEVPRIDDDLIDELFYQEDEIGEMRHTAFMIECGLEEDPPDGPDIPPVPWGDKLMELHRSSTSDTSQSSSSSTVDSKPIQYEPPKRRVPQRTRSTDDIDLLEVELSPEANRRKLVACKSGSLHAMRPPKTVKRQPPPRCHSVDQTNGIDLSLAFAKTEGPSPSRGGRTERKLVAAKSGSLHGMRDAAAKAAAAKKEEEEDATGKATGGGDASKESPAPRSPVRRLVAAKSGTLHGMRKAVQDNAPKTAESNEVRPPRPTPRLGGLGTKTKSGTNLSRIESMRGTTMSPTTENHVVYKNGVKTVVKRPMSNSNAEIPPRPTMRRGSRSDTSTSTGTQSSSSSRPPLRRPLAKEGDRTSGGYSSGSDDELLSGLVGDSDGEDDSEVSISTNASFNDSPLKSSPKKVFVSKKIAYSPAALKIKTLDAPSSPSDAKKPPLPNKKKVSTTSSSNTTKEKKKKGSSVQHCSASDASPSPTAKKSVKNIRAGIGGGVIKSEEAVESAVSRLRNGASTPAQLLQSMQCRGGSSSSSSNTAEPKSSPRKINRTKSGTAKLRSKSVGNLDIPPAFRGI